MPLYNLKSDSIEAVPPTTFAAANLRERDDLQRILRDNIEVLDEDLMVIAEEFSSWDDSRRRIDLLAIDRSANLVVIELKRTEDGGHMELQALRYAAMVSAMTFEQAAEALGKLLKESGKIDLVPRRAILDFLGWDETREDDFGSDVKLLLVSADFSKELTSSVLWLNERQLDIRCIRLRPHEFEGNTLLDVQQVIPLVEAEEYQIRVREKAQRQRVARSGGKSNQRYDISVNGETLPSQFKGRGLLRVVQALCETGIQPAECQEAISTKSRPWLEVPGEHSLASFLDSAATHHTRFDARRWFLGEEDLVLASGSTWAFSTQWGGDEWMGAMNDLKQAFPQFEIDFVPSESGI